MTAYQILPSLLSANLMHLERDIRTVLDAGADQIHIDVMDNHYVPNLTFGPALCEAIHQAFPDACLDVHLMTAPVDALIPQFAQAGARRLSIHPEATLHLDQSLKLIQDSGCQAGLVLNPATAADCIRWTLHRLDFVLIMTVNPGFGGQTLIPDVIPKITELRNLYPTMPICVDGGVTVSNIRQLADAGATEFVAGSAIFNNESPAAAIQAMRSQLAGS